MQPKIKRIPLADLAPNIGQIPGLPMNPRQWTKEDVEKIATSLKETPELFEARPIIAVPFDGKFVILGGNLRYEGACHNGDADAPVCVLPANIPVDKMKEIVVKDNGVFGAWDVDSLANEWGDLRLTDWGVPEWVTGNHAPVDESALAGLFEESKGKEKPIAITIQVPAESKDKESDIRAALTLTLEQFPGCKVL